MAAGVSPNFSSHSIVATTDNHGLIFRTLSMMQMRTNLEGDPMDAQTSIIPRSTSPGASTPTMKTATPSVRPVCHVHGY